MGLTQYDAKTPKSCAKAFDEVQKWLVNRSVISCNKNAQGTWLVRTSLDGKQSGWIVWNPERTIQLAIPKEWGAKTARGVDGVSTVISQSGQLLVGSSPVLLEN
jgi:phage-related tail fiber protein